MRDFFLYIHTFDALPHFPRPDCVGKETRGVAAYRVEGRWKRNRPRVIFQYTLSGTGIYEDSKGKRPVNAGTGFLCEAHDPQMTYYFPSGNRTPWQFVFIDMIGSAAHAMARDLIKRFGPLYELPAESVQIRQLLSFHVYHEIGCTLALSESTRLATDLLNALTASKTAIPEKHADHALIRRFQEIVQSEISRALSVGEIAERLDISAEHLARIFKQQTGISPHVHIQNAKMLAACGMLKSESLPVKEIAWRLGYETPANFMRTFQRVVRCTPLQFRRNNVVPLTFGASDSPRKPKPPVELK
jgi:AraC-like DNA-binding protein